MWETAGVKMWVMINMKTLILSFSFKIRNNEYIVIKKREDVAKAEKGGKYYTQILHLIYINQDYKKMCC